MHVVKEICTPHDGPNRDRRRVGSRPMHAEKRGGVGLTVTPTAKTTRTLLGDKTSQKISVSRHSPSRNRATHGTSQANRRLRLRRGSTDVGVVAVSAGNAPSRGRRVRGSAERSAGGGGVGRGCDREWLVRVCFQTNKCVFLNHPIYFRKCNHAAGRLSRLSNYESKLHVPVRVLRMA